MRRALGALGPMVVAACGAAFAGCSKAPPTSQPPPVSTSTSTSTSLSGAASSVSASREQAALDAAAVAAAVLLAPEQVPKYIVYQKERLGLLQSTLAQWRLDTAALGAENPGAPNSPQASAAAAARARLRITVEEAKLGAKVGLSLAETRGFARVVDDIAIERRLWKKTGAGVTEQMRAELRRQLRGASADKKAQMRAAVAETMASVDATRDATEARGRYGEALVEAVIAHEDELAGLAAQQEKILALLR